jgi:PAS domain-containing protein
MPKKIDLEPVKKQHLDWIIKVKGFIDDKNTISAKEITSHLTSGAGLWYYSEGKNKYSDLQELQGFEIKQMKLHKIATEIYEFKLANDVRMAKEYFIDLVLTSTSILKILSNLQELLTQVYAEKKIINENQNVAVVWDKALKLIIETDTNGNMLFVNENFAKVCDINDMEIIGKPLSLNLSEDMPKVIYNLMVESAQKLEMRPTILKFTATSGKYFWVLASYNLNKKTDLTIDTYTFFLTGLNKNLIEKHIQPLYNKLKEIETKSGVNESCKHLNKILEERNRDYDNFISNLLTSGDDTVKSTGGLFGSIFKNNKKINK